jgi:excinuclease ABC subunit C
MIPTNIKIKNNELPDSPGVYLMKDGRGEVIYVGKAVSLKRRVSSYFTRPHDARIQDMVSRIRQIDYLERPTAIEALILEANLIKHLLPKYNILQKDQKSFLYLAITKDEYPKPILVRGKDLDETGRTIYKALFGPYTSGRSLRAALDLLRRIFPWSTCEPGQARPCFNVHLGLCPGVCVGLIDKKTYGKIIRDLMSFFEGKKEQITKRYRKEMQQAAKKKDFERAADLRNKVFALEHIQDVAVLKREDDSLEGVMLKPPSESQKAVSRLFGRIEGYDISNISGTSTVASMVVFEDGAPAKAEYRKFRIRSVHGSNDVGSMVEVLARRVRRKDWRKPTLILIDGGLGQVNAAIHVLQGADWNVPILGIAKGPERKRNDLVFGFDDKELQRLCHEHQTLLEKVRDEAHRFAITYHRKRRSMDFLPREPKDTSQA